MSQVLDFVGKLSRRPQSSIAELKRLANLSLTSMAFEERIEDEAKTVKTTIPEERGSEGDSKIY